MSRLLVILLLCLIDTLAYGQLYNARDYYPNGRLKYKGKYKKCVTRDVKNFMDVFEKRKSGKWIYYYSSGAIMRIEHHEKIRSCKDSLAKDGVWQYFSENGTLYKTEKYELDSLIYQDFEIYNGEALSASVRIDSNKHDTIYYQQTHQTKNYIKNPGFESYYYKPVHIVNNGQNQIEQIIPDWFSPDGATPDYYNKYRSIKGVADHFGEDIASKVGTGYLGLMLYFHPNLVFESWEPQNQSKYGHEYVYSETIQTRLKREMEKGKRYCLKLQMMLSNNAGLKIDGFGVYFSENEIRFKPDDFPGSPHIRFSLSKISAGKWGDLCGEFLAQGNEQVLTLGRFIEPDDITISKLHPSNKSTLDINHSAYYLLDNIELYEVTKTASCGCENKLDMEPEIIESDETDFEHYFKFTSNKRIILHNVKFDFDKSEIKKSSFTELEILKEYLNEKRDFNIVLIGHTDNEGSGLYNKKLSLERAEAIKVWLVEKDISPSRISCIGRGFDEPIAGNLSESVKSKNRRVEFQIVE